jgi:hypothetical protein
MRKNKMNEREGEYEWEDSENNKEEGGEGE